MAVLNFADRIYLNGQEVDRVYLDGVQVYPDLLPETKAIITRANSEGFITPTQSTIQAIDAHIRAKIADGTWEKTDRYKVFSYNDLLCANFSLIDWKDPEGALSNIYGGMTYTVNGWQGNNVDGYIDPKFNPLLNGDQYQLNDAGKSIVVYKIATGEVPILLGVKAVNNRQNMYGTSSSQFTIGQRINSNSNILNIGVSLGGVGTKSIYRQDSENVTLYNNHVQFFAGQASSSSNYSDEFVLLMRGGDNRLSDAGISKLELTASLTEAQHISGRESFNTYLTSIGLTPIA